MDSGVLARSCLNAPSGAGRFLTRDGAWRPVLGAGLNAPSGAGRFLTELSLGLLDPTSAS